MSQAEQLSPEKEARILAGAEVVFAQDGYEGASMSRIAQEAGVSKGTLYNYFTGKAELFSAFVNQLCRERLAHVFGAMHPDGDPAAALRALGFRMIEMMLSPTAATVYRVVVSEAEKFPELAQGFYRAGPATAMGILAEWLAAETRRGRLAVPDPQFAAEQFFALCQTRYGLRCKLRVGPEPSTAEMEMVAAEAVRMFLNTYGVSAGAAAPGQGTHDA